MNTVKSFWVGWGSLIVAGGGAYYFAKRSINADRHARLEETRRKKTTARESLEYSENLSNTPQSSAAMGGRNESPGHEANGDAAPMKDAPAAEPRLPFEKSKYETATPFRSPRGDRFS